MFNKVLYFYYKWKIYRAVSKEQWEFYSGISGLLGFNTGISSIVYKIKNGIIAKFFFSSEQKDELLKYCFKKIVYLDADKEVVKELIIRFADSSVEYIASWLRKRLSILRLPIVKEAILSGANMNQYIFDLLSINNSGSDEEESLNIPSIGAKNSVPIELVEKMYELQAKGCPSKNGNKNEDDNEQGMLR